MTVIATNYDVITDNVIYVKLSETMAFGLRLKS